MYRFFFKVMIQTDRPIILASRSPRRSHLLRQIGIPFTVRASGIDETFDGMRTPDDIVQALSLAKASSVAKDLKTGIVIGADTIVVLGKAILGKPSSKDDAARMLSLLSGKTHTVFTGFALVDVQSGKSLTDYEKTEVTFRPLGAKEIHEYVASGSPMDKAGAYGIQDDYGAVFVEKINGCFYTVVGFPLSKFYMSFKTFLAGLD
ncbi:MAG TPA: Maf family protein [Bacteroidota bacterium]|nr:Maf family protein [Bacteroidota bacterium]